MTTSRGPRQPEQEVVGPFPAPTPTQALPELTLGKQLGLKVPFSGLFWGLRFILRKPALAGAPRLCGWGSAGLGSHPSSDTSLG